MFRPILAFLRFFVSGLGARMRQTHGQTSKQDPHYGPCDHKHPIETTFNNNMSTPSADITWGRPCSCRASQASRVTWVTALAVITPAMRNLLAFSDVKLALTSGRRLNRKLAHRLLTVNLVFWPTVLGSTVALMVRCSVRLSSVCL